MRRLLSATALSLALASPAYAYNEYYPPPPGDVRNYGAVCDAQILYSFMTVTAGSGGTRVVSIASNLPASAVGKKINVGLGGVSAGAAWQGVISAVALNTITVTAPAGTAVAVSTDGSVQWGTDDTAAIQAAVTANQGVTPIIIPGQCGVSTTINLTANNAVLYGTIPPQGHHDHLPPYTPPLTSAFVWLGGNGPIFTQTSITGASNFESKYQHVHDVAFYGGNSASAGRTIATIANSQAENLYAADSAINFLYGLNGATALYEVASTCNLTESGFVSEGWLYGSTGYYLGGGHFATTSAAGGFADWNTCGSVFNSFQAFFGAGEAASILGADHNIFHGFMGIANGALATAASIHFSSISPTINAEANKFIGLNIGNMAVNTQGLVLQEGDADSNMIIGLNTADPPVGWKPLVSNLRPFTCTTDQGAQCITYLYVWLLTCNAYRVGLTYSITDANVSTFGAVILGGSGTGKGNAYCDGTNWTFR